MPETQIAPVQAAPSPAALDPKWKSSLNNARKSFYAAGGCFLACLVLFGAAEASRKTGASDVFATIGLFGLLATVVLSGWASLRTLVALGRMVMAEEPRPTAGDWLKAAGLGVMAFFGGWLALFGLAGMARGRQLRRRGKVILPPLAPDGSWAGLGMSAELPAEARERLAARWRENAKTEHASVAAFAKLTLDLIALGAPPSLIAKSNRDSLDEVRHTELCFSLAKAIDGRDIGPGPFPEPQDARTLPSNRTLALAKLAVDSLIDGALHEGLSARILSKLRGRCRVESARDLLRELSLDESRHCAHGWDAVEWCLAEGGAPVAAALRGAAAAIPEEAETELPEEARPGAWEAWGIHGEALERAEHRALRESVVRRVETMTRGALA